MENAQAAVAAPDTSEKAPAIRTDWLYKGLAKLDASCNQLPPDVTDHALVYDPVTGLMEAIRAKGFNQKFLPDEAVAAAEALRHAGFGDWVVPDVPEGVHSVDYMFMDPAADPSLYPDAVAASYWTRQQTKWSENETGSARSFFCVSMAYGVVHYDGAYLRLRVRPVRRGVPASQCLALGHS